MTKKTENPNLERYDNIPDLKKLLRSDVARRIGKCESTVYNKLKKNNFSILEQAEFNEAMENLIVILKPLNS